MPAEPVPHSLLSCQVGTIGPSTDPPLDRHPLPAVVVAPSLSSACRRRCSLASPIGSLSAWRELVEGGDVPARRGMWMRMDATADVGICGGLCVDDELGAVEIHVGMESCRHGRGRY